MTADIAEQGVLWHTLTAENVAHRLGIHPQEGLSDADAKQRLEHYGPNDLVGRGAKSWLSVLWDQLTGVLVVMLILAAIVSACIGLYELHRTGGHEGWPEVYDAIAIAVIVVLNTVLGFTQEYRAERAMAALKRLSVPNVRVRRAEAVREAPASLLVPGDVMLLDAGVIVPADARLVGSVNLRVQEAALTGESEPVEKSATATPAAQAVLGDRLNMIYRGTAVTYGRGNAIVVATGMRTEIGRIAGMIRSAGSEPTPLQRQLKRLGRSLAVAALVLVGIIFAQGLFRGGLGADNLKRMFLVAISMAVAAVPEGLPAVVTITLALGAQRMLRRNALVRKLMAVETLGSVTVICSDKTGTLTESLMSVEVLDAAGDRLDLREHLTRSRVNGVRVGDSAELADRPALALTLICGAMCNDAALQQTDGRTRRFLAVGDPTEGALVVAAAEMGLLQGDLGNALPRVSELPFDSHRKRMTTVHRLAGDLQAGGAVLAALGLRLSQHVAFVKGSVDGLLSVSNGVWEQGRLAPMDEGRRRRLMETHNQLAGMGMRVLGFALKTMGDHAQADEATETGLVFIGLAALLDPPRTEAKAAVAKCHEAGIRPVMITGDHPLTAWQIAGELGIADDGRMMTGAELDRLALEDLEQVVEHVSVYARVSPEHKLNIVQALQDRGHVVAMTGDGVNDAPALKKADIGVAMGITGTDVSKEAADMVLRDDNFATIVSAVEEGRVIYDNVRKFIRYLLATNSGEIWVMFLAPLLGMPLPLIPLQILWINLMTDGLPALALGLEPAERDVMRRRPNDPRASIFSGGMGIHIIWVGLLMALASLAWAAWYWFGLNEPPQHHERHFRTMVFTIVTLTQMANVLAIRTGAQSLFRAGLFSNKALLGAAALTVLLQLALIYAPFLQRLFETVPLTGLDLLIAAALSSSVFVAVEIEKLFIRRRARNRAIAGA